MRAFLQLFCGGLFLCLFFVFIFQNRLLYDCGSVPQHLPPAAFGLPTPVKVNSYIVSFERRGGDADTVIYYFHGNGVRRENDYWRIGKLYAMCNCTVYAVETQNCLEPSPFGNSWHDVMVGVNYALGVTLTSSKKNYLLGASIGTAHVLAGYRYLRERQQSAVTGIILENPFTTVSDLAGLPLPLFNRWNNAAAITYVHIDVPVLFLTSERDEIVPPTMSSALFDACYSEMKRQVVLSGALHGHAASHPDYYPAIAEFMKDIKGHAK